jgi:hypothetical protein
VVVLSFAVAPNLQSVDGQESLTFAPDLPTCELVLRAWPNSPSEVRSGTSLTVDGVTVDGQPGTAQLSAAGAPAGSPGTLIDIPLSRCLRPGQSVRAALRFRLNLGPDSDEVVGYSPATHTAWFATGFPLLAWVRGRGWARDPGLALDGDGDFPVSEDFSLTLLVAAPADDRVVGTGVAAGEAPGPAPGMVVHRFNAEAVRDVAVSVGHFAVLERQVGQVRLHLATPSGGSTIPPAVWADELATAVTSLCTRFGSFPYPDLWVTVVSGQDDGQEYPDALQLGDRVKQKELRSLVSHEVSHQWFYALVGNNQAEDPWLDEALATFGEALVSGDAKEYRYTKISRKVVGLMGRPMSYWAEHGGSDRYDDAVYNQGAAVLLEARRRVGASPFDTALRSYIVANAHRVAAPADFARAFAGLPPVRALLVRAGALPSTN